MISYKKVNPAAFIIGLLKTKKSIYSNCLEALDAAASAQVDSIGILVSGEELKQGMSWDMFLASNHFLKDSNCSVRYIRLGFGNAEHASILKRKIIKNKAKLRDSLA